MFRKQKIRKLKRGLSRKFGMSFAKIGQAIRKKRRVKILRERVQRKKRSKIVGIFEKQQEEKSLFFKN